MRRITTATTPAELRPATSDKSGTPIWCDRMKCRCWVPCPSSVTPCDPPQKWKWDGDEDNDEWEEDD
jgi:hypothetical protein